MLNWLNPLSWFQSNPPSGLLKRKEPALTGSPSERLHGAIARDEAVAKKQKTIDLTIDDDFEIPSELDKLKQLLQSKPTTCFPQLICDKRRGLYYKGQSSSHTHDLLLDILKEKYKPSVLNSKRLQFKTAELAVTDVWLNYSAILKFSKKLEAIYSDFYQTSNQLIEQFLYHFECYDQAIAVHNKYREQEPEIVMSAPQKPQALAAEKRQALKDKKHMMITANDGLHFYALFVDLSDKGHITIHGADSLGWLSEDSKYLKNAQAYFKAIYPKAKLTTNVFAVPNQGNAYDCGVSVCAFMEKHAQGKFDESFIQAVSKQKTFDYGPFRQHIAGFLAMDEQGVEKLKPRR